MKKIELDRATCMGSATCVGFVPKAIKIDKDGRATVFVGDTEGVDSAALDEAIANCPVGAIRLVDAG